MKIARGFHKSVHERAARKHGLHDDMPFRGAIFSRVVQGDGDSERVRVETAAGSKTSPFAYPFASRNAWIRGQPEATTTMISIIGGDTMDIQPISYYDPAKSGTAKVYRRVADEARQYPSEDIEPLISPYRSLAPGELDVASNFAQTYLGKGDVHQSRGGLSHWTLSSLEARLETPMFTVKGPASLLDGVGTLQDEVRFGTVRRAVPNVSTPTHPSLIKDLTQVNTRGSGGPVFAKEFSVLLDWFGSPGKLIDHRQGIVVDDNGSVSRSSQTQKPLRAKFQWFTVNGFTSGEIDDAGNALFETSQDASEGMVLVVPSGDLKLKVGGQNVQSGGTGKLSIQTTNDVSISADRRFALVAADGFQIRTPTKGTISANNGVEIKAENGTVKISTTNVLGVKIGSGGAVVKDQYPVLLAHPQYISSLNNYYSAQVAFSQSAGSYGSAAAQAWAAVGPLLMVLDPSGVVMGLCQAAGAAGGVLSSQATPVSSAVQQHLPRLAQMPSGFISQKIVSE